jgi:uncharacterized protein YndB with AHSA1/START domain
VTQGDDVLRVSVRIAAPPAAIFPYFTDPALLNQWIGEWSDLKPVPGGVFALDINKTPVRGEYVELDPPHRVVFTWGVAGKDSLPPSSTRVEIVLTEDGAETVVELSHFDLPANEVDSHRGGWTEMLGHLPALWI